MDVRVLQVLGRSAGGIARHVGQVTEALGGRDGLDIDIAGPPDLPVALPKPVIPLVIPDGPLSGHLRALRDLRTIIDEGDYRVVHAHGLRAGIDAGLAVRGRRTAVLTTVHNLIRPEVSGRARAIVYRRAETLAVRLADRVFAVSEDMARHLRGAVEGAPVKVETLYLGIGNKPKTGRTRAAVRRELGVGRGRHLIVTASRLAKQKALPVMLEAVARLDADVLLVILGLGPLESELRAHGQEHGAHGRVAWLGFRADVADYIAAADVFCLSSVWEGMPLSAQEAILLGTPVVATDVGGMSELIIDGESGRLVPKGDVEALAGALGQTLRSVEDRVRYARRARADLKERFSTKDMLVRLEAAYRDAAHHEATSAE